MRCEVIPIIPQLAKAWLERRHPDQRGIRKFRVAQMARDLQTGGWTPTGESIIFDVNGWLVDGQHRLLAIVESGVSMLSVVVYDVPAKAMANMGSGLIRSVPDGYRMSGDGNYTNRYIAMVTAARTAPLGRKADNLKFTRSEMLAFIGKYQNAFDSAYEMCSSIDVAGRSTKALVARAIIAGVDRERLREFCVVLKNGMSVSENATEDSSAIVYRDYLRRSAGNGSHVADIDRYEKGQSALSCFLARRPLFKLKGTSHNLFPLPNTVDDDGA